MYRHVLIATDGSAASAKAVEHGLALAKALGAKASAVTATDPWSAYVMAVEFEAGMANAIEEYEKACASSARKTLEQIKSAAARAGIACETVHVADRRPAEAIIETAEKQKCDLIIMGSHGRRGVERLLLGSQAADVVTHSSVPVLVVR